MLPFWSHVNINCCLGSKLVWSEIARVWCSRRPQQLSSHRVNISGQMPFQFVGRPRLYKVSEIVTIRSPITNQRGIEDQMIYEALFTSKNYKPATNGNMTGSLSLKKIKNGFRRELLYNIKWHSYVKYMPCKSLVHKPDWTHKIAPHLPLPNDPFYILRKRGGTTLHNQDNYDKQNIYYFLL